MTADVGALEATRALLPWWVQGGAFVVAVPAALLTGYVATGAAWLAGSRGLRTLPPDAPWHERARATFPARRAATSAALFVTILVAAYAFLFVGPLHVPGGGTLACAAAVASALGSSRFRAPREDALLGSRRTTLDVFREAASKLVVVYAPVLVALAVWSTAFVATWSQLLARVGTAVVAYTFIVRVSGVRLACWVRLARTASPRVSACVARATEGVTTTPSLRAGTRTEPVELHPLVLELPWRVANAFAFPFAQTLAITRGALDSLTDAEIEAVARHELGHLTESKRTAFLRGASFLYLLVAVVPLRLLEAGLRDSIPGYSWLAASVLTATPLVLFVFKVVGPTARKMEERADAIAHDEDSEGVYARALMRIYEANLVPIVLGAKKAAHPDLYDRVLAAGVEPGYPRPDPPRRNVTRLALAAGLLVGLAGALGPLLLKWHMQGVTASNADDALVSLAMTGEPRSLGELARMESARGDDAKAATFYAACQALDRSVYYPANRAIVLSRLGRCNEARQALRVARDGKRGRADERGVVRSAASAVSHCDEVSEEP